MCANWSVPILSIRTIDRERDEEYGARRHVTSGHGAVEVGFLWLSLQPEGQVGAEGGRSPRGGRGLRETALDSRAAVHEVAMETACLHHNSGLPPLSQDEPELEVPQLAWEVLGESEVRELAALSVEEVAR